MDQRRSEPRSTNGSTTVERKSDRELVVTRIFDAPPHIVFDAWTRPELFMQWWMPKSIGIPLLSCEIDVRTGGGYRLEFGQDASSSRIFFGKYLEVVANQRIVWTNEEEEDGAVTTVTFTEEHGRTQLVFHEIYPSRESLDEALAGSATALPEQFGQLDALLETLGEKAGHP